MFTFVGLQEQHWSLIPDEGRPTLGTDTKGIVALDDGGELVAACVFDTWAFNSCQIHIYIANPFVLKHGFAEEVFDYAFNTCGKGMVIGVTAADNAKALKFIKNIGLQEIFRISDGYKVGVDFVITQLRREDCKWVEQPECLNTVGVH
tara:strand:- start:1584 stop:2027 length:444 start_codon:yes stop_codon:yes gene_type:complete